MSEIGLGTAALGYVYGIGPRELLPEDKAIRFIQEAVDLGITFIDTAKMYGVAEERVGKSGVAKKPGVIVSTKCGHVLDRGDAISDKELAAGLRQEVEESLRTLKLDCIELIQVHGGTPERIRDGSIIRAMQTLKDEGKVRFVGIATRGVDTPLAAIESGFFDVLQMAYSIIDQRVRDVAEMAHEHRIGVINRSVFLKGVLSSRSKFISLSLPALKERAERAAAIAKQAGLDVSALALRFALSNPAISTVLVGTTNTDHLRAAIDAARAGTLPNNVLVELQKLSLDDVSQVDPRFWPADMVADTQGGKKITHAYDPDIHEK
jgi:aryl-alcohol dehydrogenase-like predicted oxidoreductase